MTSYGSIEVLTKSATGFLESVYVVRQGANPVSWLVTKTEYNLKSKWEDRRQAYVARQLRIPTGEYMVEYDGEKEWIRVFADDVTIIDFR